MKIAFRFCLLVAVAIAGGCQKENFRMDVSSQANPFTHLDFRNDPGDIQFAIVADRTGGAQRPIFAEAIKKVNLLHPEFVMCVGDLIEGYTEDPNVFCGEYDEMAAIVDKLDMPFFYLPGNHDITNAAMKREYLRRHGRSYYHFLYKDVLFLCLDTQDPPMTGFSKEQKEYFLGVLEKHPDPRHTFVFMHQPMWVRSDLPNWRPLKQKLVQRPVTVFAGHLHWYRKDVRDGRNFYVLATTGGGRSEGAPAMEFEKGRFDHITWVTVTGDDVKIANILCNAIYDDEPVRVERPGVK